MAAWRERLWTEAAGYAYTMPKKKYRAALQSALSAKLTDGKLIVVSDLSLDQPKTKLLAQALMQFSGGEYALIIAGDGQSGRPAGREKPADR